MCNQGRVRGGSGGQPIITSRSLDQQYSIPCATTGTQLQSWPTFERWRNREICWVEREVMTWRLYSPGGAFMAPGRRPIVINNLGWPSGQGRSPPTRTKVDFVRRQRRSWAPPGSPSLAHHGHSFFSPPIPWVHGSHEPTSWALTYSTGWDPR